MAWASSLSFKGIAEGVENTNYVVHTTRGPFILTLYEKRVDAERPAVLPRPDGASGRATASPARRRCATPRAAICGSSPGRPAALVTFLEGVWVRRPRAAHCAAVGRALAQLHLAGEGFALRRANALGPAGWRPLL